MEIKYIVFFIALFFGVPAGVLLCFLHKKVRYFFLLFLIWSTCVPQMGAINFFSREYYKSMTRGLEFSIASIATLILLIFMFLKSDEYKIRWFPPLTIPYALYILVGFLSWIFAGDALSVPEAASELIPYKNFEVQLYPMFELNKILWGALLYFVIVNFIRTKRDLQVVIAGFAIVIMYVVFVGLKSRYIGGVHRVSATLGHPNTLSTYLIISTTFVFAFCLQQKNYLASLFLGFVTFLGTGGVILTISRGGFMGMILGLWLDFVTFFRRNLNMKNLLLTFVSVMIGSFLLFSAWDTLMGRFVGEQDAADDLGYRQLYNDEAKLMVADNPLVGVGLGNFSAHSWNQYAARVDPTLPPGTPPHNIWYLTFGETGWLGLGAFLLIWLRFFQMGGRYLFRKRNDVASIAAAAAVLALLVGHLQFALQLSYRQSSVYLLVRIMMGVVAAVWCLEKEAKKGRLETISAAVSESA